MTLPPEPQKRSQRAFLLRVRAFVRRKLSKKEVVAVAVAVAMAIKAK